MLTEQKVYNSQAHRRIVAIK